MLHLETQPLRPNIQTQSPGRPGSARQPQTQTGKIQTPCLGTAFPFELGIQCLDHQRLRFARQWYRQPRYRDPSFDNLWPGITPLAGETQIEAPGETGRQRLAQNARQATQGKRARLHLDLTAPGRFKKRIAEDIGAYAAIRAQVAWKIGMELQLVAIAIIAQTKVHAPD